MLRKRPRKLPKRRQRRRSRLPPLRLPLLLRLSRKSLRRREKRRRSSPRIRRPRLRMRTHLQSRIKRGINVVARINRTSLRWSTRRRIRLPKRQRLKRSRLSLRLKPRRRKSSLRLRRHLPQRKLLPSPSKLNLRRSRRNKLQRRNRKRKSLLLLPPLRKRSLNLSLRRLPEKRLRLQELRAMAICRRSCSKRRMKSFLSRRPLTTRMQRLMIVMLRLSSLKNRWQYKLKATPSRRKSPGSTTSLTR